MAPKKLNLLGEVCPIPLIITQHELAKLKPNEVLLIETDYNQAVRNILKYCDRMGYDFTLDEREDGIWEIQIRRQ